MAVTPNVVWNLTVPDTSLMITYNSFNRNCPITKGTLDCSSSSSHISNDTQSSLSLTFIGTSIFLFGSVDGGTQYTVQLDDGAATPGSVTGNNLLASFTNLATTSNRAGAPHQIILSATRFKDNSILQFTGAVISVDAGSPQAEPTIQNYILTDQNDAVKLTPGWTTNGTYTQSGVSFAQQASINFRGSAVMAYGLCSNTREDFSSEYGQVETDLDSFPINVYDSSDHGFTTAPPYIANDCLLYYKIFPSEGLHNLTYDSDLNNVFLHRFDVISGNGGSGTPVSSGPPNPTGGASGGNGKSSGSSVGPSIPGSIDKAAKAIGISVGAIIGIIVALIGLVTVGCVIACIICRRRRKARPTIYGNAAAIPSMSQSYAMSTPAESHTNLTATTYPPPPAASFAPPSGPPPTTTFSPPQGPPPSVFSRPPGPPPSHTPAHTSSTTSRTWSSHGSQRTTTSTQQRPTISTSVAPTASSVYSPGSANQSPDDPYAGMASFHDDPFAFAGRGVVLSAEGMHNYDRPSKVQAERVTMPVNRVGEASGSSSIAAEDVPPPVYQETDIATRPL